MAEELNFIYLNSDSYPGVIENGNIYFKLSSKNGDSYNAQAAIDLENKRYLFTQPLANTTQDGLMSKEDKQRIDSLNITSNTSLIQNIVTEGSDFKINLNEEDLSDKNIYINNKPLLTSKNFKDIFGNISISYTNDNLSNNSVQVNWNEDSQKWDLIFILKNPVNINELNFDKINVTTGANQNEARIEIDENTNEKILHFYLKILDGQDGIDGSSITVQISDKENEEQEIIGKTIRFLKEKDNSLIDSFDIDYNLLQGPIGPIGPQGIQGPKPLPYKFVFQGSTLGSEYTYSYMSDQQTNFDIDFNNGDPYYQYTIPLPRGEKGESGKNVDFNSVTASYEEDNTAEEDQVQVTLTPFEDVTTNTKLYDLDFKFKNLSVNAFNGTQEIDNGNNNTGKAITAISLSSNKDYINYEQTEGFLYWGEKEENPTETKLLIQDVTNGISSLSLLNEGSIWYQNNTFSSGTLPTKYGGTGSSLETNVPNSLIITQADGSFTTFNTNNYAGTLYKTAAGSNAALNWGVLPISAGGTGTNNFTSTGVIIARNNNANDTHANLFTSIVCENVKGGALFTTKNNVEPQFGTLPVAQGGTGAITAEAARTNLGTVDIEFRPIDKGSIPTNFNPLTYTGTSRTFALKINGIKIPTS